MPTMSGRGSATFSGKSPEASSVIFRPVCRSRSQSTSSVACERLTLAIHQAACSTVQGAEPGSHAIQGSPSPDRSRATRLGAGTDRIAGASYRPNFSRELPISTATKGYLAIVRHLHGDAADVNHPQTRCARRPPITSGDQQNQPGRTRRGAARRRVDRPASSRAWRPACRRPAAGRPGPGRRGRARHVPRSCRCRRTR